MQIEKGMGIGVCCRVGLFCVAWMAFGCDQQPAPKTSRSPRADSRVPAESSVPSESRGTAEPVPPSAEIVAATKQSINQSANRIGRRLTLIVQMDGFANDTGVGRVAVYLGKAHFNDLDYAIAKESIAVVDSKAEVRLELEIAADQGEKSIAVCVYHDENDNSRLDKNAFGIPIERYGFSKNPKRGFGPPKFSEVAIAIDADTLPNEAGASLSLPITIR